MRQLIKSFLLIGVLAFGLQSAWAFSLLGPSGFGGDNWQVVDIGYNPLPATDAAYGIVDPNAIGPKNLGEGYRRNTPVMYYAFDPSYSDFFGSNGEYAVQQAFDMYNGILNGYGNTPVYLYAPDHGFLGDTNGGTPVIFGPANSLDSYSAGLSGFPLNTEGANYEAQALGLQDIRSFTMAVLAEELGLADAVRYTWGLHTRYGPIAPAVCPNGMEYSVDQRNFSILPSPLNQVQYSPYVNDALYNYYIYENCGAPNISPPRAAALPIPADPLVYNPPVSSGGAGVDFLGRGKFYTGLTRDDVAGLRFLYSTNNYDTPSTGPAYQESPAAGSAEFNYSNPELLYTSNYNYLVATAMTNDPGTVQGLFPGIDFTYQTNYWSNVVSSSITYVTNYPYGGVSGQGYVGLQTNYSTNLVDFFIYTFDNVVTNKTFATTTYKYQTITVGPPIGSPVGSAFVTNISYSQPFQSNIVSGDYFVLTNGMCPPNILLTLQTNVNIVTNFLAATTNSDGSSIEQNLVYFYTNYIFEVNYCTLSTTNRPVDYQGIGRMQFIRVRDDNYDYLNGQFVTPITNQYTMVQITNGVFMTRTFQRVLTFPDFLIDAADLASGPGGIPDENNGVGHQETFNTANVVPNLAGPGTIDPPDVLTYSKTGTLLFNAYPFLTGPAGAFQTFFLWGSFDGTTNAPVVYPNGTSLNNLAAQQLANMTVNPQFLPDGTNKVPYSVTFSASGRQPPYNWSLSPLSGGLPPGLTLSTNGVVSGTPASGALYPVSYPLVIRVEDSSTPPYRMDMSYSITIHP